MEVEKIEIKRKKERDEEGEEVVGLAWEDGKWGEFNRKSRQRISTKKQDKCPKKYSKK